MKKCAFIKKINILLLLLWWLAGSAQNRTLDYYIDLGLKNSPLLKDYQVQIASNSIDSLKVRASFKPQVGLIGQIYYPPNFNGYGYDQGATNGGNYQAQVNFSQPLIMKKSKQAQFENLNILNQYIGNASKISELDLKKAITTQYISAYGDYNVIQSAQDMFNLLNDEEEMLKPLVQRGIYMQNDFLNVRMVKETQLLTIRQARIQYQNDLYMLNIICGLDDTVFAALSKPEIAPTAMFDAENSVLLRQYRLDSLKFMNRKKLVDLNYVPKLSAIADAGLLATNPLNAYKNFGAGIGLNFSMPLYDGKQRKMEYQKLVLAAQVSHN